MIAKRTAVLERLLPACDPFRKDPQVPFLAPVITLHPSNQQSREEEEVDGGKWDDEESCRDGWPRHSADCIEYCLRLCNLEIDYYVVELSRTNDPHCINELRLAIMDGMDERDQWIIEHVHFFPERRDQLREARRNRISIHLSQVVRAHENGVR